MSNAASLRLHSLETLGSFIEKFLIFTPIVAFQNKRVFAKIATTNFANTQIVAKSLHKRVIFVSKFDFIRNACEKAR